MSNYRKLEQLLDVKYYRKPTYVMLEHERRISLARDFIFFDLPNVYRDVFVIRVERRSRLSKRLTLDDKSSFTSPLSLKLLHFERFRLRKHAKLVEFASAPKVSFVISVQPKLRVYIFFTAVVLSS